MKLILNNKFDVIYVNRAYLETAYPAFAAHLLTRTPIVCDWDDLEGIHGFTTSFRQPLRIQIFETINELLFPRFSDAVVVASRYLATFTENIGVKAEEIYYSPSVADDMMFHHGVDGAAIRSRFGIVNCKVLLYCGNLSHGNGVKVENILYTLKNLLDIDSTFFLLVVGDGDMLDKNGEKGILVQLAETLGISEHVVFTGGVPYKDVPQYIAAADICLALFPVNLITMCKSPLKVYEYMACGKPVIARDVGEISHCIEDGQTGLLVYSDNPEEYSEKIRDAFSREGFLEDLGRNARQVIETRFSWKFSADRVIEACESCLAGKKRKIKDSRK